MKETKQCAISKIDAVGLSLSSFEMHLEDSISKKCTKQTTVPK